MKKKYTIGRRLLALALCLCLTAALLPQVVIPAVAVSPGEQLDKTVDSYNIHDWKAYFGPDVMSTEYAGGVWTDKSVFQSFADYREAAGITGYKNPAGAALTNAVEKMLDTDPENFLVTMSAISANKAIRGSSTTPMDTMLVLDVSGSMQGSSAVELVRATNQTIDTLLRQNTNNRVGVVLYSGNHDFGDSETDTASVLLPLGRYSTTGAEDSVPTYLTISGSGDNQTVKVHSSVANGQSPDSKAVRGGTYIQNGLYQAWKQFEAVTDTVIPEGQPQKGAKRVPVLVLMTDGAPTAATGSYHNVGTSSLGDGSGTTNRYGFLTQLTAAWVRGKMAQKYSAAPKFYTLGFGTGNDTVATSVLNPAGSNSAIRGYWETYLAGTDGQNVRIVTGNNGWSVYKDPAVAGKNYVDQYWLAGSDLVSAFGTLTETIVLQAERHTTLISDEGADLSGYVTFEDELGELMEVKAVKGMTMGDKIFTGAELAKNFNTATLGTPQASTAYGDALVRTVKSRLGITSTATAQQLIADAFAAGQISYKSATEYSNYIGWYADAEGNFLGFWEESLGYEVDPADYEGKTLPTYINRSYGYLGAAVDQEGAADMMHVVVMVHTEIATGHQSVVFKIPASLLPTVTYEIDLDGSDLNAVRSMTRDDAQPMRLLLEVGLRDGINSVNLVKKLEENEARGGHFHRNDDGSYTFYTNRWGDGNGGPVNYDAPLTHLVTESHFNPSLDNTRYYHVEDAPIYADENGTPYRGSAAPSGSGYYFAKVYYQVSDGTAQRVTKYAPLGQDTLTKAQKGEDGWFIPAGTPQQLTRFAKQKADNSTDTLNYAWNPVILHNEGGYNSYAFLGNNGSFRLVPAQGIAIHKTVSETVPGAPEAFTFTVTLDRAVATPTITDDQGAPLTGIATVRDNVITLTVKDGQTVCVTGLPTGTAYTVAEVDTGHYTASLTGAAGTVAEGVIQTVEAYNVPRIHGDLIVSKDVLYPDWMTDISALEAQRFTLAVELSGADPETTYETSVNGFAVTTDTAGSAAFTVSLQDAQSMTVYGLPAGAAYTVREENTPAGYQSNGTITGTVPERGAAEAAVVNTYAPAPAETTLTITGTKHFLDSTKQSVAEDRWPQEGFTMELHRVDFSGGTDTLLVDDITATAQDPSWSVELPLTFPKTGVYYYRICEKAGTAQGVIYDTTNGIFRVLVTDNGTGTLIVSAVEPVRDTVTVSGTTITKDFCNYLDTATVQIPVKKIVTGTTVYDHDDFLFGLYDEAGNLVDTVIGNGTFQITGEFADTKTYTIRELIPEMDQRIVGMTYDDTVYTVTVTGDEVTIRDLPEGETGPVFHNTYEKVVSYPAIDLGGTKTITGDRTAFLAGESYTFELYETDASFRADHGKLVATETVDGADPAYGFAGLTFTEEGTYYFVLKEQDGTQGGITYDHTRYHVTIRVTKAEDGTGKTVLQAAADITRYGSNEKIPVNLLDFANTYRVSGTGQLAIDGTKTLVGRDLTAGLFSFTLSQGDQVLQTVQNSLSGKFRFDPITYTAADLGDHTYTVREVPGDLPGMTYDDRVYTVTVRVSDDGQGGLRVERTGEAILFENTYTPKPISTTIRGTKTLYDVDKQTYIELGDHEFAFELYRSERDFGEQKELLQTATVDDTGNFSFKLHYDTTCDNYYIIREVIGDDPEIAYDAGRYLVRILVSDNGAGELVTTMTLVHEGVGAADLMIFENRFDAQEKPEPKPEPETPNTGDDFRLLPVIGCMVASLMGLAVVTVLKKRSAK